MVKATKAAAVDTHAEFDKLLEDWYTIDDDGVHWAGEYRINAVAADVPMMTPSEMWNLRLSIREDGLRHKVVPYVADDGVQEILDGRHRLLCCLADGIEPEFDEPVEGDAARFVLIENIIRRHLSKSQMAMRIVALAPEMSAGKLSEHAPVSKGLLSKAKTVQQKGTKKVKDAVQAGDIVLTEAEDLARLPDEEADAAVDDLLGDDKAKAAKTKASLRGKSRDGVERSSPAKFVYETWIEKKGKSLSKDLSKVPPEEVDRCKLGIGEMLSVRIRRSIDDAGGDNELAFLENDTENLLLMIDEKIAAMPRSEQKKAKAALRDRWHQDDLPPKKADEVLDRLANDTAALSAGQGKELLKRLGEQYHAPVSTKCREYLPGLPEDHKSACDVITKEVTERVTQLKTFEGWADFVEPVRKLSKHFGSKSRQILRDSGVSAKDAEPALIDITWPEHLDTDEIKEKWRLYLAKRTGKHTMDTDRLQLIIASLSQFEHEAAVELLVLGRSGAKGTPWASFDHKDLVQKYGVRRDKKGKLLGDLPGAVNGSASEDDWNKLRLAMLKLNADFDGPKIRKAVDNALIFAAGEAVGLSEIQRAKGFDLRDKKEMFLAKLTELRGKK